MKPRSFLIALIAGLASWARPAADLVAKIGPVVPSLGPAALGQKIRWPKKKPFVRAGGKKHTSRVKSRKRARAKAKRRAVR